MRLRDFALLTDESIQRQVAAHLRARGFDVLDVREAGLMGSSDVSLPQLAYSQKRVVVTHDSDFGALSVASMEPVVGLVFLRPGHIDAAYTIQTVDVVLSQELDLTRMSLP